MNENQKEIMNVLKMKKTMKMNGKKKMSMKVLLNIPNKMSMIKVLRGIQT
jgi:hypothetical protein